MTEIIKSASYNNLIKNYYKTFLPEYNSAKYDAINFAKIDFIIYALDNNLIDDSFICWCDFGYFGQVYRFNKKIYPTNLLDIRKF